LSTWVPLDCTGSGHFGLPGSCVPMQSCRPQEVPGLPTCLAVRNNPVEDAGERAGDRSRQQVNGGLQHVRPTRRPPSPAGCAPGLLAR
jgi:hypothetical protein